MKKPYFYLIAALILLVYAIYENGETITGQLVAFAALIMALIAVFAYSEESPQEKSEGAWSDIYNEKWDWK